MDRASFDATAREGVPFWFAALTRAAHLSPPSEARRLVKRGFPRRRAKLGGGFAKENAHSWYILLVRKSRRAPLKRYSAVAECYLYRSAHFGRPPQAGSQRRWQMWPLFQSLGRRLHPTTSPSPRGGFPHLKTRNLFPRLHYIRIAQLRLLFLKGAKI